MPVLQYLDIAIGYAFAMLLLATLTGAVVEAIQGIFRSRTFALEKGLENMIENLGVGAADAKQLAKEVTADAPVKGSFLSTDAVQREEFIMILLRKAVAGSALREAVARLAPGKDPEQLLREIEQNVLKMEAAEPDAPSYVWRVKAMEAAGAGALAGRVFSWYDNMTRRVDDAVNFQGRAIGLVAAGLVCFWLAPVDSIDLLRRLGRDEVFRKVLVERAIEEVKKAPPGADRAGGAPSKPAAKGEAGAVKNTASAPLPAQAEGLPAGAGPGQAANNASAVTPNGSAPEKVTIPAEVASPQQAETNRVQDIIDKLATDADQTRGLLAASPSVGTSLAPFDVSVGRGVTWVMVSLGSAFWVGLLKKLVGLKSSLTEKLETQRLQRESDQRIKAT